MNKSKYFFLTMAEIKCIDEKWNKKALIGKIIFVFVVIVILAGAGYYIKFRTGNLELTAGDIVLNIDYNISKTEAIDSEDEISIIDRMPILNRTNATLQNISYQNNSPN